MTLESQAINAKSKMLVQSLLIPSHVEFDWYHWYHIAMIIMIEISLIL